MEKKRPKPRYRKRDLISLVWPVNTCYSDLIVGIPKGVTVDTVAGTWTFQGQTYKIGDPDRCSCRDITGNPIGVYDMTKIRHLNQMKDDAEWVRTRFHFSD